MEQSYVQLSLRTKVDTFKWEYGEELIDTLYSNDGLLVPELVSHNPDRFKEPFPGKEACQSLWAAISTIRSNGSLSEFHDDFAWKRKNNVKYSAYIRHARRTIKGDIASGALHLYSKSFDRINWWYIFKEWCEIFPPQVGMLHLFTQPELSQTKRGLKFRVEYSDFKIGSFGAAWKPEIPNVAWAMAYGDEFADKVDAERISAAGFPIERLGAAYLVRVTENIQDIVDDFPLFSRRRAELKSLFPKGLFLIDEEPSSDYRT